MSTLVRRGRVVWNASPTKEKGKNRKTINRFIRNPVFGFLFLHFVVFLSFFPSFFFLYLSFFYFPFSIALISLWSNSLLPFTSPFLRLSNPLPDHKNVRLKKNRFISLYSPLLWLLHLRGRSGDGEDRTGQLGLYVLWLLQWDDRGSFRGQQTCFGRRKHGKFSPLNIQINWASPL